MTKLRMRRRFVLLGLLAAWTGNLLAAEQPGLSVNPQKTALTNLPPLPPPAPPSPIAYFRQLLEMPLADREKALAAKSPSHRQTLEARLQQYDALPPEEREIRLQGLKLRSYLLPLMRTPASNRAERLASIPAADLPLVEQRLWHWDQQPKELQNEFLENEQIVRTIVGSETNSLSPQQREEIERRMARWNALPAERQKKIQEDCRDYFELNDREREKTLNVFTLEERRQMEKTLQCFKQLPPGQRERCISGFQKFTELSPEERQEFLKNAQHWQQMSPKDRQVWRALVSTLTPPMPPLPQVRKPVFPSIPARTLPLATNQNP